MKILLTAMLMACAASAHAGNAKGPLDARTGAALREKTLVLTVSATPDFSFMRLGPRVEGKTGNPVIDGRKFIDDYQIADPARALSAELTSMLEASFGIKAVAAPVTVSGDSTEAIATAGRDNAPYALDVRTVGWVMAPYAMDWFHYRVRYGAEARLVDTSTMTLVASGRCSYISEADAHRPSYEEVVANNANWLKTDLALAVKSCVADLKAEMLGL